MSKSSSAGMRNAVFRMLGKVVHVNGDLNKSSIVTNVVGIGSAGCFVGGSCYLCLGKCGIGIGLLISAVGLGRAYYFLDNRDHWDNLNNQAHEERMAKIKHPNSPIGNGDQEDGGEGEDSDHELYKPSEAFSPGNDFKPMVGYLLPEGFDGLVYGSKGSMKSTIVLGTMAQIAVGEIPSILPPAMRDYQQPNNVFCLYVDGENGKAVINQMLGFFGTRLDNNMKILEAKRFGDDLKSFRATLFSICSAKPAGTKILLAVDNLKSNLNDMSSNQDRQYLNMFKELRKQLALNGISLTTITIHHTRKKGDTTSGSCTLPDLTPYVFKIEKCKDKNLKNLIIEHTRTGDNEDSIYSEKVTTEDYRHLVYDHTVTDTSPEYEALSDEDKRQKQYAEVKNMLDSGTHWEVITRETGVTAQCFQNWKKKYNKEEES